MSLLTAYSSTGLPHPKFCRRRRSDGAWWNVSGTPAFEAYNVANIASYGIVATETGATGVYTATDPADTIPGDYLLIAAAGASLVASDIATNIRWQDSAGVAALTGTLSLPAVGDVRAGVTYG